MRLLATLLLLCHATTASADSAHFLEPQPLFAYNECPEAVQILVATTAKPGEVVVTGYHTVLAGGVLRLQNGEEPAYQSLNEPVYVHGFVEGNQRFWDTPDRILPFRNTALPFQRMEIHHAEKHIAIHLTCTQTHASER